jgi:biotin carboxylase
VLLLVPAVTYRAADFLHAATRLGLDLVVGSDGALPLGDHPVVRVDPKNLEKSIDRLLSSCGPVDAIVAVDTLMLTLAAAVAAKMGLPHNPLSAVEAAGNKLEQRRLWAASGVPQPAFQLVPAGSTERAVRRAAAEVGFPCVVKAVSLSGGQGVLRADDGWGAVAAAKRIRRVLTGAGRPADEPLLVEEYVAGWELSIDGLTDAALTVTAVFDKPDIPDGPTFEETFLISPPRLPNSVVAKAVAIAEQAARALGLRQGPIHAELRIDARDRDARPTMLELAARSIGGLCSRALHFLDGVSLEEMVLANALGHHVTPFRANGAAGVLMLPVERAGLLRAVEGKAEAAAVPGITGLSITISVGQPVHPLPEGDRYLGFVFAEGETADEVEAALRAARQWLRVDIR